MKRVLLAVTMAAACLPALAQTNVGVSVQVGQPGFYGRIDIGNVPTPPVVVYQQPVVIAPTPVAVYQRPIYLHVPPGHAKNWGRHCARYNACGQPVYFVQEQWYQQKYVPVARRGDRGHDHDRHDDRRDHHGGNGHGHGHGHGKH
jgi:hypothetical protein